MSEGSSLLRIDLNISERNRKFLPLSNLYITTALNVEGQEMVNHTLLTVRYLGKTEYD